MLLNKRFKRNCAYFLNIEQPFEQTNQIPTNKSTSNNCVPNLSLSTYSNTQIDPILKSVYSTDKNFFFLNFVNLSIYTNFIIGKRSSHDIQNFGCFRKYSFKS